MAILQGAIVKIVARHTTLRVNTDRGICLHIAVSNGASLYNYFNQPGNPTSHFYVRKTGNTDGMADFEQYVDTKYRAPANLEGNPTLISIETQGGVEEDLNKPWSATMVKRLAWIVAECHRIHGVPIQPMPNSRPESNGVGYHRQGVDPHRVDGGEKWSTSYGKVCPGQKRIDQIPSIITMARSIAGGDDMPTAAEIADAVWAKATTNAIDGKPVTALNLLRYTHGDVAHVQADVNSVNSDLANLATAVSGVASAATALQAAVDAVAQRTDAVAAAVNADEGGVWAVQIADVNTLESGDTSAASSLLTYGPGYAGEQALAQIQPHLDEIKTSVTDLQAAVAALTPPVAPPLA